MSEIKKSRLSTIRLMKDTVRSQIRCRCPAGHAFWSEVFTSLNAVENAQILDAMVSVGLQQARCTECGKECLVAEPVTIHDPAKKRFALFIPGMLSHRELELRAALLEKLMNAVANEVPPYFSDFKVLVGRTALGLWLASKRTSREVTCAGTPLDTSSSAGGASSQPSQKQPSIPKEGPRPIHEAFADLEENDSYVPSYPPESDSDDTDVDDLEDDWFDDRTFGSGVHMKPSPSDPPPLSGRQAIVDLEDSRIVLIQRAKADIIKEFDPKQSELLFQLHRIDGFPLVVLTLVSKPGDEKSEALHWFVDITKEAQKNALKQLQKEFAAEVRLYTPDLVEAMRFDIGGPREPNVALAMKKIGETPEQTLSSGAYEKAKASFASLGDPLGRGLGSFALGNMTPARNFEDAFDHMAKLAVWLRPERFEKLTLVKSYPIARLEEIIVEVIKEALGFGVHLPDELKDRAVALGLAANRKEIISKTMATFDKLLRSGKRPRDDIAAANWHNALKDCDKEGIEPEFGARKRADELLDKIKPGKSN